MKKIAVILIAVINIIAFYYGVWRIDYDILMPGGITEIEDKVNVEDASKHAGTFNSVFVYSLERPTRFMVWLSNSMIGVDSYEMSEATSSLTNSQLQKRGELLYETGLEYSLIHAYEAADAEIKYFMEYISILYYDPTLNDLDIGLEITGVDGVEVTSLEDFSASLKDVESAILNTNQGDYEINKTDGVFGIQVYANLKIYEADPAYTVFKSNVSGSSGGLLQTLSIFNQLTETDYTYGLKIAGTGTIYTNGYVGPIGAVEQKVIAAAKENVDIFFVPSENYADAIATKEAMNLDLNIVEVLLFSDAVEYLMEEGASLG